MLKKIIKRWLFSDELKQYNDEREKLLQEWSNALELAKNVHKDCMDIQEINKELRDLNELLLNRL